MPTFRYRLATLSLVLVAILASLSEAGNAQSAAPASEIGGTLYYIVFPDTVQTRSPSKIPHPHGDRFLIYIYSGTPDNTVTYGRPGGQMGTITIGAGEFETVDVSDDPPIITTRNTKVRAAYVIRSEEPVIAYCYMATKFGAAAFTPIPVEDWGTDHFAMTFPGEVINHITVDGYEYSAAPAEAPAEIVIVAAYDNTKVNIQPSGRLKDCFGCASNITLNAGDCYLVQSEVDIGPQNAGIPQQDLGGSYITSNKRIGVLSGNTRAQLNAGDVLTLGGNAFKDLMIEWVPPVEQHGTEFAYTPNWDRQRWTSSRIEETRRGEVVRAFGTSGGPGQQTDVEYTDPIGMFIPSVSSPIAPGEVSEDRIGTLESRLYHASAPAMLGRAPEAVVKFNGTTSHGGGTRTGSGYDAWGTYMAEMVPRERWTSFAPFITPDVPDEMEHVVNVVAKDEEVGRGDIRYRVGNGPLREFIFDRGYIPGSDLAWGTMTLTAGTEYTIEGRNGARFTGIVYGFWKGWEYYRPESRPAIYEERIGLTYGYPLASRRCSNVLPDSFTVEVAGSCPEAVVDITSTGAHTSEIASIALDPATASNFRIAFVDPSNALSLSETKVSIARVRVEPIDMFEDARGNLIISGRSCSSAPTIVPLTYAAPTIVVTPESLDFGPVLANNDASEQSFVIANTGSAPLDIMELALTGPAFRIVRTEPATDSINDFSYELPPGEELRIFITVNPAEQDRVYRDSLYVRLPCAWKNFPLRASTTQQCLTVIGTDVGTIRRGTSDTVPLQICNDASMEIRFDGATIDEIISGTDAYFQVSAAERTRLRNTTLQPGECTTINLVFATSDDLETRLGNYTATVRVLSSSPLCEGTGTFTAMVIDNPTAVPGNPDAGFAFTSLTPNPTDGAMEIAFSIGAPGRTTIDVFDVKGRRVGAVLDRVLEAGEHRVTWNGGELMPGVYVVAIRSGEQELHRRVTIVR